MKLLASFVGGAIAVTKGATYALARVTDNAKLAAEVLATGIPGIEKAVAVLNVVGVFHGALMLIDPDSTGEQRAEGALELTVGGLGIAPMVAKLVGAPTGRRGEDRRDRGSAQHDAGDLVLHHQVARRDRRRRRRRMDQMGT